MADLGGFARLSLTQQADIIQSLSTLVAERQTPLHHLKLYALDTLYIELSFLKCQGGGAVDEIKYINHTAGLQPYLDEIKLSLFL